MFQNEIGHTYHHEGLECGREDQHDGRHSEPRGHCRRVDDVGDGDAEEAEREHQFQRLQPVERHVHQARRASCAQQTRQAQQEREEQPAERQPAHERVFKAFGQVRTDR